MSALQGNVSPGLFLEYYLCDLLSVISKQLQLNKKSYYINQTALNDQILTNLSSVWNFGAVRGQGRQR